jgi:hypothetical protein
MLTSERIGSERAAARRRWLLPAAGASVATVAVAGVLLAGARSEPQPLELALPDAGGALASCLPFTVEYLAEMPTAFAGTVTGLTDGAVALRVDRWYAGGEAPDVVLTIPPGAHAALIGTIDFAEGREYLVTAVDGAVNLCGYSGAATPQLLAAFDAAF